MRGRTLPDTLVDLLRVLEAFLGQVAKVFERLELISRVRVKDVLIDGDEVFAIKLRGEVSQAVEK